MHGDPMLCANQMPQDVIADETLRVMRRCVPAALPGIMFLSGGQVGRGRACTAGQQLQGCAGCQPSACHGRSSPAHLVQRWVLSSAPPFS